MKLLQPAMIDNPALSSNQKIYLACMGLDWVCYRAAESKKVKNKLRDGLRKLIIKFRSC